MTLYSQTKAVNREKYRINISHTDEQIKVDGLLNEESWQGTERAGNFTRVTPVDTGFAVAQTVVYITYDKSYLYVGAVCFDPLPGKRPVESLRRDFEFNRNDNFRVHIDTYNNLTNGYAFGISAAGAQSDGVIVNGSQSSFTWDTKWKSAVKSYDDRWVAEMAIPFRSLRYFGGENEWGINFGRLDLKSNEKSAWAPVPRQFPHNSLPYAGTLVWDKPLDKAGLRLSLIPYATLKVIKNSEEDGSVGWKWNAGFDTKMILSTSMNLDLTFNPDYSQVEEDRQQTNLDRFELFYPERRQFFLENSDLFSNLGNSQAQPFFSRRIGLNVPVNFGGRLTGRIGNKWRIGLMDIQTVDQSPISSPLITQWLFCSARSSAAPALSDFWLISRSHNHTVILISQDTITTGWQDLNIILPMQITVGRARHSGTSRFILVRTEMQPLFPGTSDIHLNTLKPPSTSLGSDRTISPKQVI